MSELDQVNAELTRIAKLTVGDDESQRLLMEERCRLLLEKRRLLHPDAPLAGPSFEALGQQIGALVEKKQAAYGDSFGKSGDVMRILYPCGISAEQLDDALTVVRVLDKLFQIATARDAFGESPWRDIAGYALLATKRVETKK